MATLQLTKTFVTLVSTGISVSGQTARDRPEAYSIPIEVRTYGTGRRRSVAQLGELGTYAFTMLLVPRATVDTLRSWVGQTVQVRDNKGRRFFGVYGGVTATEIVSRTTWHVSMSLTVVTTVEGV